MAKIKRRGYPRGDDSLTVLLEDRKYGKRGNARGKDTRASSGGGPQYKYSVAERRRKGY